MHTHNLRLNRMTADAGALADQIGAQTSEGIIRAAAGVRQPASTASSRP